MKEEKWNKRGGHYSRWHRSIIPEDTDCPMIDIDWLEWCVHCKDVLAIVETVCYQQENQYKNCEITKRAADLMDRPGYLIFYKLNPEETQIVGFVVQRIYPGVSERKTITPRQWETHIKNLHKSCKCQNKLSKGTEADKLRAEASLCYRYANLLIHHGRDQEALDMGKKGNELLAKAMKEDKSLFKSEPESVVLI